MTLDLNTVFSSYGIVILGVMAGMTILLIVVFFLLILMVKKVKLLSRSYKDFMRGKDAESLEEVILERFNEIDDLKIANGENRKRIDDITQNLLLTYQKIGIVKYDAFHEMGGKLSFALALLDKSNNGFVMNSMHNRESCYTYIKEIIDGKSYITLSDEEKKAVDTAINFNGLE